jgi:hypothetical protein
MTTDKKGQKTSNLPIEPVITKPTIEPVVAKPLGNSKGTTIRCFEAPKENKKD